ncbi:MAG: GlcG/HbpS family heme-binding protein [Blastocatellia bacterium]
MIRYAVALCIALLLSAQVSLIAQDPPPSYGPAMTLEQAKKAADAAEAEARKNKWNVVIAIVDSATNLVLLHRMDDTQLGSIKIAQKKAHTAAALRRSTKVFEDQVTAGGAGMRTLANDEVIPIEGGLPIWVNGKIAGAIGVSGVTSQQDGVVAKAGADAVK